MQQSVTPIRIVVSQVLGTTGNTEAVKRMAGVFLVAGLVMACGCRSSIKNEMPMTTVPTFHCHHCDMAHIQHHRHYFKYRNGSGAVSPTPDVEALPPAAVAGQSEPTAIRGPIEF
jgi:hypothetical protein